MSRNLNLRNLYHPTYLGDSVYCGRNHEYLVIGTCNNGTTMENIIYLEPEVIDSLIRYCKQENLIEGA